MSASTNSTRDRILNLLNENQARYQQMSHEALGFTSDEVARVRNVELGQCSKAAILKIKGNGVRKYVLAVLPGDRKINTDKLSSLYGGKKASFASAGEVLELTSCVPGALAPFSFNEELALVVDPSIFERYSEIAFNAGTLTETIVLNVDDYRRIVKPKEYSLIQD
ncbi:YbaK/prolyl-tRNA synthetase associated domain-containing protein [Ferrovibrio terrae]|uniref:YbaK/prolyl-tRNA synthetase associated domain-containing protein n=1 Tax=Ferrovibrio terrae TaxID=2594003 RepID=A0A516H003_9PROT|nr:YbaK/EbsC family protein [Ferrovibrio terrae]QDO97111.1 YbaK/prolyl-tRNA synthetase associated domain-containing protein [Ferrovibrio terrae]